MRKLSALFAVTILAACSRPPVQQIADAQAAISGAVQAGAEDYAIDNLRSTRDTLTAANTQVEAKDYKGAKVSAIDAKARAEAAMAEIEAGKTKAKRTAGEAITSGETLLRDIETLLAEPKLQKATPLQIEGKDLRTQFDAMKADFDAGRYKTAADSGTALVNLLENMKIRTEEAKKAPPKKKKI